MKLAIVSNGNAFSTLMLRTLIDDPQIEVVAAVVVDTPPGAGGRTARLTGLARRTGWRYTGFKIWSTRVVPAIAGAGTTRPLTLAPSLRANGVPVLEAATANGKAAIAFLRAAAPEILVSVSSPERFDEEVLRIPSSAAINLHWAKLPAYGGIAPYFWMLARGEREAGVTLHTMTPTLDAGPILCQQVVAIEPDDSVLSLQLRLAREGACVLAGIGASLGAWLEAAREQDLRGRSYFGWPEPRDVLILRRRGRRLARARDLFALRRALRAG